MRIEEIENFANEVKTIIRDWFKNDGFKDRKLTDLPTDDQQVANKRYVDEKFPVSIGNGGTGGITQQAGFDNLAPTTSQGDIIYHNGVDNVRLGAGTAGYVLRTGGAGADPSWAAGAIWKNGTTNHAGDGASGNQTIAHGLGVAPVFVRISASKYEAGNQMANSWGVYNGTTYSVNYMFQIHTSSLQLSEADNNAIVHIASVSDDSIKQVATITVDATNITLAWTKTGSPSSNSIRLMWEACA